MMTKEQAEAIYQLAATSQWQHYMAYKQTELDNVHKDLEWEHGRKQKQLQGMAVQIKRDMNIINGVNAFLDIT